MATIDLVPTIQDGEEFVSDTLRLPTSDVTIGIQTYGKEPFSVEGSIDEKMFYAITNFSGPGLNSLTLSVAVIRVRAANKGEAPYALILYPEA